MFSWSFSSRKDHSVSWYVAAIVIVLILVVYGIVEKLWLMSVVSFLLAGVYLLMENNATPTTQVNITDRGIQVGESFFEYSAFARFAMISIADTPSFIRLYPNARLSPVIDIPLSHEINSTDIRVYLSEKMTEELNNTISNTDALMYAMKL